MRRHALKHYLLAKIAQELSGRMLHHQLMVAMHANRRNSMLVLTGFPLRSFTEYSLRLVKTVHLENFGHASSCEK
jgi:hypothetical protein